jgi:hypothetical protein
MIVFFTTFRCLLIAASSCPLLPGEKGVRKTKYAVFKSLPTGRRDLGRGKITQDQWDTILI